MITETWRLEWSSAQQAFHLEPAHLPRTNLAGWKVIALGIPEDLEPIITAQEERQKMVNTLEMMAAVDLWFSRFLSVRQAREDHAL